METLGLIILIASVLVFIYGKVSDYRKSVSRIENPELTPRWQDEQGRFDSKKFALMNAIMLGALLIVALVLYVYVHPLAVIPIAIALVIAGIKGVKVSKT